MSYSYSGIAMNKAGMSILVLLFRWTYLLCIEQWFWSLISLRNNGCWTLLNLEDAIFSSSRSALPVLLSLSESPLFHHSKSCCSDFPLQALCSGLLFNYRCLVIWVILMHLYISFAKCQCKPPYFPPLPLKLFEDIFICSKQKLSFVEK